MIDLNSNKYQANSSYGRPQQQYTGDTVGIMSSTSPAGMQNKSLRPQVLPSTKRELDLPAYMEVQQQARNQNRRVTFDEFVGVGNNPNDYRQLEAYYDSVGMARPAAAFGNPYQSVFDQQKQMNYGQAAYDASMNRINEFNPYGSSQYITNADGTVSRVSELSQPNQQLLDQQYWQDSARNNAIGGMLENYAGSYKPMSQDYQGEANRVENDIYGKYARDLDQNFARQQEALRAQLLNSGASIGSEKYTRAMQDFERSKADAYGNARTNAIAAGRDQGNYLLNQELQRRQQPLSEMSTLQSQVRGPQNPSFSGNYNVQMPYMDMAAPSINYADQQTAWAREDKLREEAKKSGGGGGGGRRGGGGGTNATDQAMLNYILSNSGGGGSSVSPLISGLAGAAPLFGAAIGGALWG